MKALFHYLRQRVAAYRFARPFAQSSAYTPEGEKKLGIALVGLGGYSQRLAAALQQTEYCRLAGLVTGNAAKGKTWAKKFHVPETNVYTYASFDQISHNPDIDIVYVVLPNALHAEYVIRVAKVGKHVICEKPMAVSVAECKAMITACREAGKQLSIGYRLHFEPFTREVMRIGQQQVFGKVQTIEAHFGFALDDPTQWRLNKALAGGGALMDLGIYAIQAARYVTGEEPIAVTAQVIKTNPITFKDVEETITWQLEFPGGAVANSSASYTIPAERLFVTAEQGWIELQPAFGYGPLKGRTHQGPLHLPIVNHHVAQLDGITQALLAGQSSPVPGEEGLRDMKVIEAIYEAAETGKQVAIG